MGAQYLEHKPPSDEYEVAGWKCTYHSNFCHNPLDCEFIPLWVLKPEHRQALWAIESLKRRAAIAGGACTTCAHSMSEHTRPYGKQMACAHPRDRGHCSCAGFRRDP